MARTFYDFIRPRTESSRPETVSMPASYWLFVDGVADREGSNRSKVLRALVTYARGADGSELPAGAAVPGPKPAEPYAKEKISLPSDLWAWVDSTAARAGSDRSKVLQAAVAYAMVSEVAA
jgi:hypothetical protein